MIDPLYDGEDEKYGDERHLNEEWQKIRKAKSIVVNPKTGLSWVERTMGEEIRSHLNSARGRLWDIRDIGLHHDYNVGIKTARAAERTLEILDYIPLFLNEMNRVAERQSKVESMLCRVADELDDPMSYSWCDEPEDDRKLLESLRDDVLALIKELGIVEEEEQGG